MRRVSSRRVDGQVRPTVHRVLAVVVTLISATAVCACSQSGGPHRASSVSVRVRSPQEIPIVTTSAIPPGQHLRGDGDADNPRDLDGNGDEDGGEDRDEDYAVPESYRLPDGDDRAILAFGHAPSRRERVTIERTALRYYSAAAGDDGAAACLLLPAALARSLWQSDERSSGARPPGATTCAAVLAKLFAPLHEELSEPITIVAVRVDAGTARVVFSSRKLRASSVSLLRWHGRWMVEEPLGQPLP